MVFEILIEFFLLMVSLLALAYSSKIVLESSERLATYFGLSKMAIGFILISVLTSLPEFSIAVFSAATHNNNISIGDLLGSNVTNIALILGIFLFLSFKPLKLNSKRIKEILLYLFISFVPVILFLDGFLSLVDGLILIVLYVFFLKNIFDSRERIISLNNIDKREGGKYFMILLVSILVVFLSSEFAVNTAVKIALNLNLFQSFIGGTIIALSTSLPELALTLVAVRKRLTDIALGNLIGSNVTNITLLFGVNTLINPFAPNIAIAANIFAFIFLSSGFLIYKFLTSKVMNKNDGLVLVVMYVIYLIALSTIQITR